MGGWLNRISDEAEADAGIWIADDQDQEGIAEPGSTLIARHVDLAVNPDVADVLALAIAVADYVSKHLDLKARFARLRKTGQPSDVPPPPPEQAAA